MHKFFKSRIFFRFQRSPRIPYTHTENIPSNKTQALAKSTDMDIWVIDTLNQVFIRQV